MATEYLFGESSESLLPQPRINTARFSAAVEKSLQGIQRRVVFRPVLGFLPKDQAWHHASSEVDELFNHYIDIALADQKNPRGPKDASSNSSRAEQSFVMLRELVKETQDRHFLRNQLLTVFLPMYQAAPFGLSNIIFQVARAPESWAKLRAEALGLGNTPLTFEVLNSMKYLQCVIKESQLAPLISNTFKAQFQLTLCEGFRLFAPLDRIIRICVRDCVLPCGGGVSGEEPSLVQRGTLVDMRSNIMHRAPMFWGPDANKFLPEHWLNPNLRPKWEYLPFGGGARNCPAQRMTLTQCAFIVARLAQEFGSLENRDPEVEFVEEYGFSKRSRNGVKVAFLPATTFVHA